MDIQKWGVFGGAIALLAAYNATLPGLRDLRQTETKYPGTSVREGYGPPLGWLDRLAAGATTGEQTRVDAQGNLIMEKAGNVKLDFSVLSSVMLAGIASGFKSPVANLLWMKSDEYWHQGLFTRQVPLMEAVVTLDPQFLDAWSTAGWHWAYNIYADIPTNRTYKGKGPKFIRQAQENAVQTGLDYLKRGSAQNPDKYRLWFEYGWTRAEKAGYYDDETLELYKIARTKSDAKTIEQTSQVNGETVTQKVEGLDLMGRTIGHLYERIPQFDNSLDYYADELMQATPEQRKMLGAVGEYWAKYGTDYWKIADVYNSGDATIKARVKQLVPDVERLVAAHNMRQKIAGEKGKDQPVGAYVSISARYIPAWNLMKKGDAAADTTTAFKFYNQAIAQMVGVMQVDPKYHLQGLPVLREVLELRGDAPSAIEKQFEAAREAERVSSQDLGLHFLATLYEKAAAKATNPEAKMKLLRLAYETWYRSRERDALDFYALRKTREYEDKYNFTTPEEIVKAIKASRKGGVPNAAPAVPPNIAGYVR